jgi:hypothetical protein
LTLHLDTPVLAAALTIEPVAERTQLGSANSPLDALTKAASPKSKIRAWKADESSNPIGERGNA